MKLSYYNFFVRHRNIVICYNSFSDAFAAISHSAYQQILDCSNNIDLLKSLNEKVFDQMIDNGFIIRDNVDELSYLRFINKRDCFSQDYDITIIPTLDCNLKCWYCWQTHKQDSFMNDEMQTRIARHVKNELESGGIRQLAIEWFGGEPFFAFDKVVDPLGTSLVNLAREYGTPFCSTFVTNGTLITSAMLDKLKEFNSFFQITIDGNRSKHNRVKVFKNGHTDAYKKVIDNLYMLADNLPNTINLRINYDDSTLDKFDEVLEDLDKIDRSKISIYFERIWQTESDGKNMKLFDALLKASRAGFSVEYGNFNPRSYCCKSDRYRQVAFNYDGKIFKCTGRPFIDDNSDGEIADNGNIIWQETKVVNRTARATFEIEKCLKCKMLPQCAGPCSSKCIEGNWKLDESQCALNSMEISMDEYIVLQFANRYQMQNKVHEQNK